MKRKSAILGGLNVLSDKLEEVFTKVFDIEHKLDWVNGAVKAHDAEAEERRTTGMALAELQARNSTLEIELNILRGAYKDVKEKLAAATPFTPENAARELLRRREARRAARKRSSRKRSSRKTKRAAPAV